LIMNNTFIRAAKIMRKVVTTLNWICWPNEWREMIATVTILASSP
jgi:hypothetical protein